MNSKQDNAGFLQRYSALNSNLPEVFIERQENTFGGLRKIQKVDVSGAGEIGADPQDMMAGGAKRFDSGLWEVLVREQKHLRRDWVGLVFVGQVAGVRKTREDIVSCEAGIVVQDVIL